MRYFWFPANVSLTGPIVASLILHGIGLWGLTLLSTTQFPQLPGMVPVQLFYTPEQPAPVPPKPQPVPQAPQPAQQARYHPQPTPQPATSAPRLRRKNPLPPAASPQPAPVTAGPQPQVTASLPMPLSNPKPPYPALARRMHWQGTVTLQVSVSPQGTTSRANIIRSSGYPVLDDAALATVRHWQFQPARRFYRPIEGQVTVPVVFELEHPGN